MESENSQELATFAGVDEAGLGPLLGPLCFGYSVFRAPRARADLWQTLESVVAREPGSRDGRLVVADSKVVFTRNERGAKRLERTALAFLALLDPRREPLADGLRLAWHSPEELAVEDSVRDAHPWYAELADPLPRHQERGSLELEIERLARALARESVEFLDGGVRVIPEGALNQSFGRTDNKSQSAWEELAPILTRVFHRHGAQGLRLSVDRQGGRSHYGPLLRSLFPDCRVRALRESEALSAYVVAAIDGSRRMRVAFAEKGERHSFAIALGSCLAKYARELCMDAFNANFARHDGSLSPTAGYTTDGRRWLAEAQGALSLAGVRASDLMRTR
ncbi:MAG: hypothetical protein IPK67_18025 [Planctomycetes bacterium]|nr:hypothetical protein [Planctomycetota bacterium]